MLQYSGWHCAESATRVGHLNKALDGQPIRSKSFFPQACTHADDPGLCLVVKFGGPNFTVATL
jgi:hypothetical protein